jgi:hypothetical protein
MTNWKLAPKAKIYEAFSVLADEWNTLKYPIYGVVLFRYGINFAIKFLNQRICDRKYSLSASFY